VARGPSVVGEIIAVPVIDIDVGKRLRPVDPVWATALGQVMAAEGQKTPIEVCRLPGKRGYTLVAGAHRLEGGRLQHWDTIEARVVGADALERRAREVSENLWRKGLGPIDRAAFVAEFYELQRARAGLSASDDGRKASAAAARDARSLKRDAGDWSLTMRLQFGWADGVAEQVGLSRQTIYRDLELHRGLLPDVVALLRRHPLGAKGGQLRARARMSPDDQRAAAAMIVAGDARGATDALASLRQKPRPSPETKAWSAFFGGWSRMSAAMRRDALRELSQRGLPKGCRLTLAEGE
jgi:hypothetical protein